MSELEHDRVTFWHVADGWAWVCGCGLRDDGPTFDEAVERAQDHIARVAP